jgi:hypothetical protein
MQKQTGQAGQKVGGEGKGHMYQGRFKSFAVETNEYLPTMSCQRTCVPPVQPKPQGWPNRSTSFKSETV